MVDSRQGQPWGQLVSGVRVMAQGLCRRDSTEWLGRARQKSGRRSRENHVLQHRSSVISKLYHEGPWNRAKRYAKEKSAFLNLYAIPITFFFLKTWLSIALNVNKLARLSGQHST